MVGKTSTAAMPTSSFSLPPPSPEALAHSTQLVAHLRAEIESNCGWLSFARYMELALYAPGLGYYASGSAKLGTAGDFVTAPEMTPLFGRVLARQIAAVLGEAGAEILELGAGSGRLALDLLLELERLEALPTQYRILEVSPDLRARQRELLQREAPHLLPRVYWLEGLPEMIDGVVLGNEVLDALPVHMLWHAPEGEFERGVAWRDGFVWEDRPLPPGPLRDLAAGLPNTGGYLTEVCPAAPALILSLAERLRRGLLLLLDYGFPAAEYYHPQRHMGTLKVHYRHHSLDDPFYLPGLADLTAHVDFSAVARAGTAAGLDLLGYTSQGNFLLNGGLLDLLGELQPGTPDYLRAASAVRQLVQPDEMGELFKVLALGRGVAHPPSGFMRGDRRGAL
jgi:SAM-dependent MidA family methyltransferase